MCCRRRQCRQHWLPVSIDGYCVAEPFNALGELKAGGKVLRFTGDVWKGHPCCVVVMHEENTMDPDRAAWTQGIHNAVVRAQITLAENREEMAVMLSRDGQKYLPFPQEVIKRAMLFYDPRLLQQSACNQASGVGNGPNQLPGLAVSLGDRGSWSMI